MRQRVKATAPGIRFSTVKKIFPNIKITTRDGKNEPETNRITLAEPTAEYFIDAVKSGREPLLWSAYYAYLIENNPERAERIKSFFSYTPTEVKISKMLIERIFGDEIFSSVSKLQTYRSCGFMYFLKYVLKLEEREIFSLNAADVGTFVHMVFENICKNIEADKTDFAAAR